MNIEFIFLSLLFFLFVPFHFLLNLQSYYTNKKDHFEILLDHSNHKPKLKKSIMKKTLSAIALATLALNASAQLNNQEISYFNSSKMVYDGIVSKTLKWNSSDDKFEYTGSKNWNDFSSILFNTDGAISFTAGNSWSSPLNGFTNDLITQEALERNYTRMKITYDGLVGIGTDKPLAKLHIVGTVGAGNKGLLLTKETSTGSKNLFFSQDIDDWVYSQSSVKGDFGIFWNDGGTRNKTAGLVIGAHADNTALRIDAKGNVGIGTNLLKNTYNNVSDYFRLAVKGSIRAQEIVVETGWADFVFEDDYNLKEIEDVAKFIIKNNHLPDVPSANYIKKNGVKVGEMQKIQMQKIEELTLYTIQQQSQLQTQNSLINKLINRLEKLEKKN